MIQCRRHTRNPADRAVTSHSYRMRQQRVLQAMALMNGHPESNRLSFSFADKRKPQSPTSK
ncbi:Uncharacterised protein [Vibrio cholerae]|nr:Uncharacterised protein [Vibrio cholerae]CSB76456.1 Uncharacterised protein [Vibrio cholerae]